MPARILPPYPLPAKAETYERVGSGAKRDLALPCPRASFTGNACRSGSLQYVKSQSAMFITEPSHARLKLAAVHPFGPDVECDVPEYRAGARSVQSNERNSGYRRLNYNLTVCALCVPRPRD
jgi:hypothetical protein